MSVDKLQKGIRKLKNPSMVGFGFDEKQIPASYLEAAATPCEAYLQYGKDLLSALKEVVPAVRFSFGSFALNGAEGMQTLGCLMGFAREQGFYVLLDAPEIWSASQAEIEAKLLTENWQFDGLFLSPFGGSDIIKPFAETFGKYDIDLFIAVRTANKSASELQDLLTGSRYVYTAAADIAKRLGEGYVGRCGYSRIGAVGPATSADILRTLRSKYGEVFLLIDGYDYSGANAKNCSFAFDKLGHGAIACSDTAIVGAWREETGEGDAVTLAVQAAQKMKKNLTRYVTVL